MDPTTGNFGAQEAGETPITPAHFAQMAEPVPALLAEAAVEEIPSPERCFDHADGVRCQNPGAFSIRWPDDTSDGPLCVYCTEHIKQFQWEGSTAICDPVTGVATEAAPVETQQAPTADPLRCDICQKPFTGDLEMYVSPSGVRRCQDCEKEITEKMSVPVEVPFKPAESGTEGLRIAIRELCVERFGVTFVETIGVLELVKLDLVEMLRASKD